MASKDSVTVALHYSVVFIIVMFHAVSLMQDIFTPLHSVVVQTQPVFVCMISVNKVAVSSGAQAVTGGFGEHIYTLNRVA